MIALPLQPFVKAAPAKFEGVDLTLPDEPSQLVDKAFLILEAMTGVLMHKTDPTRMTLPRAPEQAAESYLPRIPVPCFLSLYRSQLTPSPLLRYSATSVLLERFLRANVYSKCALRDSDFSPSFMEKASLSMPSSMEQSPTMPLSVQLLQLMFDNPAPAGSIRSDDTQVFSVISDLIVVEATSYVSIPQQ